ncbi:hypothetical protein D1B17_07215 [Companilactobacillus zhachilii]|uniref:Uncharacterized protein n=1 Tax=Companilactobacillus zhachilii TaxID=2304606 RepID=A0A386PTK7_9LACO|nr:hypothetical protein [Companilactobacillus zhachilii]AYE38438.2 hypothetical protein D1B17_07215 [Companilactobacillus zhachilii]
MEVTIMNNPFDKYAVYEEPSVVKFNIKLLQGKIYDDVDSSAKIKINLKVDTYIPYGTNTIQSLDFNLYAMNDRSDTPSNNGMNLKPAAGIKANVNELIHTENKKLNSDYSVFRLDHTFELISPFNGTNYNLLGVNVVINRESLRDGSISKEYIYTTVVPTSYLHEDSNGR